jgi:hypothetical protein
MSITVTRVIVPAESLQGIEDDYKAEFKYIYLFFYGAWKEPKKYVNDMLSSVNAMFIAKEDNTPVGCLFGTIFRSKYDDSFIERYNELSSGDCVLRLSRLPAFLRQMGGNHTERPFFSNLQYFVVNPALKGRGIGSVLWNSWQCACGNEYQMWVSNDRSDWKWYLSRGAVIAAAADRATVIRLDENFQCVYLYSKDARKREKLSRVNCYLDFPREDIETRRKWFEKNGYGTTVRLGTEKDTPIVGNTYLTPWETIVRITGKQPVDAIGDYKDSYELTEDQLALVKRYGTRGISVYRFEPLNYRIIM